MFHRIRREIEIARATQIDPASKPIGTLQRTAARCVNWLTAPITATRWTKRSDVTLHGASCRCHLAGMQVAAGMADHSLAVFRRLLLRPPPNIISCVASKLRTRLEIETGILEPGFWLGESCHQAT